MSMGYTVAQAQGRVAAGEMDELWIPNSPRKGRCGVVLCHGSGAPQEYVDLASQPSSVKLAAALARAGIPCVAGDFGGQAWANDTAMSRVTAAWGLLQSKFGVRSDKVCLVGVSMGGATAVRYCQLNPSKVAAMVGLIPLVDLVSFYNANVSGTQAQIAGAWGVTAPAALPASADIFRNALSGGSVPQLLGYSSVDQIVQPAWVQAYVSALGGWPTTIVTDSTYGHSDQAVGGMPIATAAQFLAANGA